MIFETVIEKRASSTKDIGCDWSAWLASAVSPTDTIASVTHTATGVEIDGDPAGVHDDVRTAVRIQGGTPNARARVTTTIVTSSGETESFVHFIDIRD